MSEQRYSPPPAHGPEADAGGSGGWRRNVALAVFGAGAAYFLLTEHLAHTIQALPWLILLLCPLLHVFMHGGHGSRGHGSHRDPR